MINQTISSDFEKHYIFNSCFFGQIDIENILNIQISLSFCKYAVIQSLPPLF